MIKLKYRIPNYLCKFVLYVIFILFKYLLCFSHDFKWLQIFSVLRKHFLSLSPTRFSSALTIGVTRCLMRNWKCLPFGSSLFFCGVRVTHYLCFYVVFVVLFVFCLLLLVSLGCAFCCLYLWVVPTVACISGLCLLLWITFIQNECTIINSNGRIWRTYHDIDKQRSTGEP